ncbi:LPXTG cell wall anchor domain-containing protein [Microbacterium lacticum]
MQPGLPGTGGTVPWWAIALGGVLVVGGASALIVAARRRRHGE